MAQIDEIRLMTRIARMYYEKDLAQSDIARQLGLSQATISRFLKKAKTDGVVRISVRTPKGIYSQLEEQLVDKFELIDAIVVDSPDKDDENNILRDIGSAAAYYLETLIKPNDIIGISSWSSTLLALVDAMPSINAKRNNKIVQILGGVGNPAAEAHANRLTSRLADLVNCEGIFLPAPGIVGSHQTLKLFYEDEYVNKAINLFEKISIALVGIGALYPSKLLTESGNIFSAAEIQELQNNGAVGDILLHFFDINGNPVKSSLDNRVISMKLEELQKVERSIGIAGGQRKFDAILGALRGRWIKILITDIHSAQKLVEQPK
ncbi:MAG: sugar-binding transcriptional regulator [Anaerolineales bacterium]|nr:sugar-binding transcriptional regulator [Anaerolineales bacterium]